MAGVCPLAFLGVGTEAKVTEIRAGKGLRLRLSEMGLCPDARVLVQCADRGSLIVSVGDARYALSRGIAAKIFVRNMQEAA